MARTTLGHSVDAFTEGPDLLGWTFVFLLDLFRNFIWDHFHGLQMDSHPGTIFMDRNTFYTLDQNYSWTEHYKHMFLLGL